MNNSYQSRYFAVGGPISQLTEFTEGGKHEENPLGGIPQGFNNQGTLNLVEEGETKLNSANYVFSDQLKVDKEIAKEFGLPTSSIDKTFADISKKLNRSNSRRYNDTIEESAKKRDLDNLMIAQEKFKEIDLQRDMQMMATKHPEVMAAFQQSYQPQMPQQNPNMMQQQVDPSLIQDPSTMPQMNKGGQMYYDFGGVLNGVGSMMKTAAPIVSKVPGFGTIAGTVLGGVGAGLENVGTGADIKELSKDIGFGALGGIASSIPMANGLVKGLENTVNNKTTDASEQLAENRLMRSAQYPDGGSLDKKDDKTKKTQSSVNPTFASSERSFTSLSGAGSSDTRWLSPEEIIEYNKNAVINGTITNNRAATKILFDPNTNTYYPEYGSNSNGGSPVPVKRVVPIAPSTAAFKPGFQEIIINGEGYPAVDNPNAKTHIRIPYNTPEEAEKLRLDSKNMKSYKDYKNSTYYSQYGDGILKLADGGPLNQEVQGLQSNNNLNFPNGEMPLAPEYNPFIIDQNVDPYMSQDSIVFESNIEDEGAKILDPNIDNNSEEYQSLLQSAQENLDDNNQDLRVQQSLPNAIIGGLPVAYNIGMGLFGKTDKLNADDYLNRANIQAPKINIDPQVRETQQTYATAQNSIANASPSSGAYMTNLQELANNRNKQLGSILVNKENIDGQNQFAADQFNAQMQAGNNDTKFRIADYNARAKGAKQQMLSTGLTQAADIAKSHTANDIATSYYSLNAPDFKDQVGYTSYLDYLKSKKLSENNSKS